MKFWNGSKKSIGLSPIRLNYSEKTFETIKWLCDVCKKRLAVYIDVERYYEDGTGFLCEECSEDEEYDDAYLNSVCNSPRMGVCGYDGSEEYPDEFVPDK